jgi:hypothetical protein
MCPIMYALTEPFLLENVALKCNFKLFLINRITTSTRVTINRSKCYYGETTMVVIPRPNPFSKRVLKKVHRDGFVE